MAFSFYSSLKSIPREMHEVAEVYRWSRWQKLVQMELPFAAIGLVWNSMVSVASGLVLPDCLRDVRAGKPRLPPPGLGSYLQTAANAADMRAIVWGLVAMIGVIVAMDQLIWRPVIAWAEKFKFEQVESAQAQHSPVLDLLRSSRVLPLMGRMLRRSGPRTPQSALRPGMDAPPRRSPAQAVGPVALLCNRDRRCCLASLMPS